MKKANQLKKIVPAAVAAGLVLTSGMTAYAAETAEEIEAKEVKEEEEKKNDGDVPKNDTDAKEKATSSTEVKQAVEVGEPKKNDDGSETQKELLNLDTKQEEPKTTEITAEGGAEIKSTTDVQDPVEVPSGKDIPAATEEPVKGEDASGNTTETEVSNEEISSETPLEEGTSAPTTTTQTDSNGNTTSSTTTTETTTLESTEQTTTEVTNEITGDVIKEGPQDKDVKQEASDAVSSDAGVTSGGTKIDLNNKATWSGIKKGSTVSYGGADYTVSEDPETDTAKKTTKFTLTRSTASTSATLKQSELSEMLGVTLSATDTAGTYTYTDTDNVVHTVVVTEDKSTAYATYTFEVTVKEGEKDSAKQYGKEWNEGSSDVDVSGSTDATVAEAFSKINSTKSNVTYKDGRISTITDGTVTYNFIYGGDSASSTAVDVSQLTNAQIAALLGTGYTYDDDGVYDSDNNKLTVTNETLKSKNITVTVKKLDDHGSQTTNYSKTDINSSTTSITSADYPDSDADKTTKENALLNSVGTTIVNEAINKTITDNSWTGLAASNFTYNSTSGNYEYSDTTNGVVYSITLAKTTSSSTDTDWDPTGVTNYVSGSGEQVTITAKASVSYAKKEVDKYLYLDSGSSNELQKCVDSTTHVVVVPEGVDESTVKRENDRVTEYVYNGKTYNFTYTDNYTLNDAEKAALDLTDSAGNTGTLVDSSISMTKVSLVITTPGSSTEQEKDGESNRKIGGTYSFVKEDNAETYKLVKTTTDANGATTTVVVTDANGNLITGLTQDTTNTGVYYKTDSENSAIEYKYEISSTALSDSQIQDLLKLRYGVSVAKNSSGNWTYTDNGVTYTIDLSNTNLTSQSVTQTTVESNSKENASEDEITTWLDGIYNTYYDATNNLDGTVTYTLKKDYAGYDIKIDSQTFVGKSTTEWVDYIKEHSVVNFGKMDADEIKAHLEKEYSTATKVTKKIGHMDVQTGSTMLVTDNDGNTSSHSVTLQSLTLKVSTNAETTANNGGEVIALNSHPTQDTGTGRYWEFAHSGRNESDAFRNYSSKITSQEAGYYYITGTVKDNTTQITYNLIAYGYMDANSDGCTAKAGGVVTLGYDLKLHNLRLVEVREGEYVVVAGDTSYSATATISHSETIDSANGLTVSRVYRVIPIEGSDSEAVEDIYGTYKIKFDRTYGDSNTDTHKKSTVTSSKQETYQKWNTWGRETTATGTATDTLYTGKLAYAYKVPDNTIDDAKMSINYHRDIDATVKDTSTKVSGYNYVKTTTTVTTTYKQNNSTTPDVTPVPERHEHSSSDDSVVPVPVIVPVAETPAEAAPAPEAPAAAPAPAPAPAPAAPAAAPAAPVTGKLPQTGAPWMQTAALAAAGLVLSIGSLFGKGKHEKE